MSCFSGSPQPQYINAPEPAPSQRRRSSRNSYRATYAERLQHKQQTKRHKLFFSALAAASALTAVPAAPHQSSPDPRLPLALKNHVAQLTFTRQDKPVHIYVLGMSHVSRQSCDHTAQLITAVKPDVVLLELCKDRVGLLVDPSAPPPQYWHSRVVKIESSTAQQPAPVQRACDSLLRQLQCQPGKAFSAHQIEQDCIQLLASGLFKSVVPVTQSASPVDAPVFVFNNNQMTTVAPLGGLTFRVTYRAIPPVQSLKLQPGHDSHQDQLQSHLQQAESEQHQSALHRLTELHEGLQSAMPNGANIQFQGLEAGKVDVHVGAVDSRAEASVTGLEGTANLGKGWGIQPFQHRAAQIPSLQGGSKAPPSKQARQTACQPWSEQDLQQAASHSTQQNQSEQRSIANSFAQFLTSKYGRFQAEAGRRVGVQAGEAWRVALFAAAQNGALQVQLCDKPAVAMSQRIADAIWSSTLPYLVASLALGIGCLAGAVTHTAPVQAETLGALSAAGLLARGVLPVVLPLLEVQKLSKLSRDEIEAAVDPQQPLQGSAKAVKLWGEDALLDWPGAMEPVIHERDAHMAQAIWAAACGNAGSPTYAITSNQPAAETWEYMMPQDPVESAACPVGQGCGTFIPPTDVYSVVAVVGTAHVYGIMKHLAKKCVTSQHIC